ncbi:MAG: hypothetical protein ACMV1B_05780 [Prevotella sp.]
MKKSEIIRNIINDDCYYYTKHSVIEIVNFIFDEHEAQLKAKDEIERLFGLIKSLWQIIDDIDTYGDMAKSDDAFFRSLVEKKQKERWKLPITTDGYGIMLKDNQ